MPLDIDDFATLIFIESSFIVVSWVLLFFAFIGIDFSLCYSIYTLIFLTMFLLAFCIAHWQRIIPSSKENILTISVIYFLFFGVIFLPGYLFYVSNDLPIVWDTSSLLFYLLMLFNSILLLSELLLFKQIHREQSIH